MRFSLRWVFAFMALVAIAATALTNANAFWHGATTLLMVFLLTAAIAAAVYGNPAARPFWFGFALFGWVAVALCVPVPDNLAPLNPFTVMAHETWLWVIRGAITGRDQNGFPVINGTPSPDRWHYVPTFYRLAAIVSGLVGGLTTLAIARRASRIR